MNAYISAEVDFVQGEQAVRNIAATLGPIVMYLPPHVTLLYGCKPFAQSMQTFLSQFTDPNHPIYTETPKPVGFDLFFNAKKNYHAVVVKYEWAAGKAVNLAAASDPQIYPEGPAHGFNGDKFTAHVTIAYVDGNVTLDKEAVLAKLGALDFFAVKVRGVSLEMDAKPQRQ